ncbi:uncharacterized protein MELLADRAFT_79007 [Melampsora larici-populina 98AG31]|uniref:Chromatin modification-related protein n=1 Tax=Melampsora larici-populina (strain 98AG31 / pathotype 3-4-7) TaxID=747676 RepID=F4S1L5_MELLP|nr:uncharacterized protein MELLADRAFT_79007 [Melampsora larici-populina 98AG31]EGG01486.1 hypothetical protein MELLADRAFT_79007 [Melampsora larici-populina 98AG31]
MAPPKHSRLNQITNTSNKSSSSSNQLQSTSLPTINTTTTASSSSSNQNNTMIATESFAQAVHLVEGFADTLDSIPPSLTRSLSDLKELDAVLNTPLLHVHSLLDRLLGSILKPESMRPDQRLTLLRSIVGEIEKYKLGGEDKIRVVNGTCESLSHHINQLDTTMALIISSLPPNLESRIPVSTLPTGYPKLTGSLRSKPSGSVWCESSSSTPKHISPPNVSGREFVQFDSTLNHCSPLDQFEPNSKRPKLSQSTSNNPLLRPSQLSTSSPKHRALTESGSNSILDQHMSMLLSQQQINQKRRLHTNPGDDPSSTSRQLTSKSTLSNDLGNSIISNTSTSNTNGTTKAKRARTVTSNGVLLGDQLGNSVGRGNVPNTAQSPVAAATGKKRVRKTTAGSNPTSLNPNTEPLKASQSDPKPNSNLSRLNDPNHPNQSSGGNQATLLPPTSKRGPLGSGKSPSSTDSSKLVPTTVHTKRPYTKRAGPTSTNSKTSSTTNQKKTLYAKSDVQNGEINGIGLETETDLRRRKKKKKKKVLTESDEIEVELDQVEEEVGSSSGGSSSNKVYCICEGEVLGERMVACDNSNCPIEWFHYQCAGLTEDPTGSWFCDDCKSKGHATNLVSEEPSQDLKPIEESSGHDHVQLNEKINE